MTAMQIRHTFFKGSEWHGICFSTQDPGCTIFRGLVLGEQTSGLSISAESSMQMFFFRETRPTLGTKPHSNMARGVQTEVSDNASQLKRAGYFFQLLFQNCNWKPWVSMKCICKLKARRSKNNYFWSQTLWAMRNCFLSNSPLCSNSAMAIPWRNRDAGKETSLPTTPARHLLIVEFNVDCWGQNSVQWFHWATVGTGDRGQLQREGE